MNYSTLVHPSIVVCNTFVRLDCIWIKNNIQFEKRVKEKIWEFEERCWGEPKIE